MSAAELVRQCHVRGIQLQVDGDRLRIEAPVGSFTPELREALVAHKPELLALDAVRVRLSAMADRMGISRAIVDSLPVEELAATAEQVALAAHHRDRSGGSLAQSLLVFYLRSLADRGPTA